MEDFSSESLWQSKSTPEDQSDSTAESDSTGNPEHDAAASAGPSAWDRLKDEVPFAGDNRLPSNFLDNPDFALDRPAETTPDSATRFESTAPSEADRSTAFVYGPDRAMQSRERSLRSDLESVQTETYKHQNRAIESIGDALAAGGFGRAHTNAVEDTLRSTYGVNHKMMQDHNDLISDYLDTKYPNRFAGSDAVANLPDAETRAKQSQQLAEDFLSNAELRSRNLIDGYQDIGNYLGRAMGGNATLITGHVNRMGDAISDFERSFARLEQAFMNTPDSSNLSAMENWITEYNRNLTANHRRFVNDAAMLYPSLSQSLDQAFSLILHNQQLDLENRKQALVDNVQFKAESALTDDEISRTRAASETTTHPEQTTADATAVPDSAQPNSTPSSTSDPNDLRASLEALFH